MTSNRREQGQCRHHKEHCRLRVREKELTVASGIREVARRRAG